MKSYSDFRSRNITAFLRLDALIDKQAALETWFQRTAEKSIDRTALNALREWQNAKQQTLDEVSRLGNLVAEYLGKEALPTDIQSYADRTGQYVADRLDAQKEAVLCL